MRKRGYFGIGIENLLDGVNIGTLWRSAYAFGADFIFTIGKKYEHQTSDPQRVIRHMPLFAFETLDAMLAQCPQAMLIGVEFLPDSKSLFSLSHPERAIYLLGSEGRGLSQDTLKRCDVVAHIPTTLCLNVASAGGIVLYDRANKRRKEA